jgi:hypothetical protein
VVIYLEDSQVSYVVLPIIVCQILCCLLLRSAHAIAGFRFVACQTPNASKRRSLEATATVEATVLKSGVGANVRSTGDDAGYQQDGEGD